MPDPTEEEPPTEEEFLELILRGEGGQPRRPIVIAMGAVLKARSDSSVAHIPVAAVVTGRLLESGEDNHPPGLVCRGPYIPTGWG